MASKIARWARAGVPAAMLLVLAACGDKGTPAATEGEAPADAVATEAMPAEEGMGDMTMDQSATDATADMAPPADPMMEVPADAAAATAPAGEMPAK